MKHFLLLFVFFLTASIIRLCGQTYQSGFSATNIGSGWSEPVGAVFNQAGTKLFVWEKGGKVYVCNWNGSTYVKQATPVLDISPEVGNWRDHGLLGFALDPNFNTNSLIYLLYVVDRHYLMKFGTSGYSATTDDYFSATIGRITRYKLTTSSGNQVADLNSRAILVGETKTTGFPILHESHGIGSLVFAADGTLLASCGDGASYNTTDAGNLSETYYAQAITDGIIRSNENVGAFKSQMLNSLNGKIIRIDPANGNGISSNPFYSSSSPRTAKSRVWAMGFRNPYRFCVKPNTGSTNPAAADLGEIYVGDVGWDKYEELDIVRSPASNCGWPIFEGLTYQSNYLAATTSNKDEPNPLYGTGGCTQQYFTFQNLIKQATADNNHILHNPCNSSTVITGGNDNRFFHRTPAIDWKHGVDSARVKVFTGNTFHVAQIGSSASGVTGTPFHGNCASGSCWYTGTMFPPAYRNTYFQADYGGTWLKNFTIQYTDEVADVNDFASGFAAIVCVTQNPLDGSLVIVDIGLGAVKKIVYGGNQPPVVQMTSNKKYGASPLVVSFTGSLSYDPDGSISSYSWNFGDPSSGSNNTSTSANLSHTFTATGPKKYVVKLTVKDNQNVTSTDSIIISANNTPPTVNITSPIKNSTYRLGADTSYLCRATVTDLEQTNGQLSYQWQTFLRHNNHEHPEAIDTSRNTSTVISRIGCNGDTYYWFIKLTVTDAAGLSTVDSSRLFPACTGGGTLPLILQSFSVASQSNGNLVKWTTEYEQDLDSFVVERSADGHQFTAINQQTARGNAGQMQYSYLDAAYLPGDNYYRLRIVDKTTGYYFSLIIRVFNKMEKQQLLVIPNPVINDFTIAGVFANNEMVRIQITDATGRIIKSYYQTVSSGFNNMQVNNLRHLQPGIYFIEVKDENAIRTAKFMKVE